MSIIRDGSIVDSAPLAALRGAQRTLVTARVDTQPDLAIEGVEVLQSAGDQLRLRVTTTALPDLLNRLGACGVRTLDIGAPSLEDLFLAHYAPKGQ